MCITYGSHFFLLLEVFPAGSCSVPSVPPDPFGVLFLGAGFAAGFDLGSLGGLFAFFDSTMIILGRQMGLVCT